MATEQRRQRQRRTAPYLYCDRNGTYYLRVSNGQATTKRSLGTKDFKVAKVFSQLFQYKLAMKKFDISISNNGIEVKNIQPGDDIQAINELLASAQKRQAELNSGEKQERKLLVASGFQQRAGKKFSEVVKLYIAEKEYDNKQKTLEEKQSCYAEFLTYFIDDDFATYPKSSAVAFKTRLVNSKISVLRINKKISMLKDLFDYAIRNNFYFQDNPFADISISRKSKLSQQVKSYKEFSDTDLRTIFADKGQYKSFMNKSDYYWLPLLSLYSGARIEELASLDCSQIINEDDIYYIDIERAKTTSSIRKVPIHSKLIDLGFIEFLEEVKKKNTKLFPHLKLGKNGYSKNCSRRFGQYLDRIGIVDTQKVFHSFRSSFINRMTMLNIHPAILMGIVGHYEQSKLDLSSPHFVNYQQSKPIAVLKDTIDKLNLDFIFENW